MIWAFLCIDTKWTFKFIKNTDLVYAASYKNNQNVKICKYYVKIEHYMVINVM